MNERELRTALLDELLSTHRGIRDTAIIEEFSIPHHSVRIDIAVVNGMLHGFELKSDRDTLSRLAWQSSAYASVFDRLTLVVGERHVKKAVEMIPNWWGVRVARLRSDKVIFCDFKLPMENPCAEPLSLAKLLRKDELLSFLRDLTCSELPCFKSRRQISELVVQCTNLDGLRLRVRQCLRARQPVELPA